MLACVAMAKPTIGQHLFLEENTGYTITKTELTDSLTGKKCSSYSILTKRKVRDAMTAPAYFVHVMFFPGNSAPVTGNVPSGVSNVQQVIDSIPAVEDLMTVGITDYSVPYRKNYRLDSVLYVREGAQVKAYKGIVVTYAYIVKPYVQAVNLATNNYFINTRAKKTKISYENGVPYIVEKFMDGDYQNKLFLVDETKDGHYHFLRTGHFCRDCAYTEKEMEFVFDIVSGITRVKTFVPELNGGAFKSGKVYYNFK
jgi:hypothetical protein